VTVVVHPVAVLRPARVGPGAAILAVATLLAAAGAGVMIGPADLPAGQVLLALVDRIPLVDVPVELSDRQLAILWELRVPRVVLGGLVGATLAVAGGAYQGVFRNPLADPYLLGVAAGAGLGATLAIAARGSGIGPGLVAPAAFAGAVVAVVLTYSLGRSAGERNPTTLVLAGVAVASFLTAAQTFVVQRNAESLREVYSWILGRLGTTGWSDVRTVLPYVVVGCTVILLHRRLLDVLGVGDEEAETLGVPTRRVRLAVVAAATMGTAAVVSVSGLIGFVGIIVPHTVRLVVGTGYRVVLPLSIVLGAAFLIAADLAARTVAAPAELPIGVITAFLGAPFFMMVLRTTRGGS
jgi:iron complex transport system permease protein